MAHLTVETSFRAKLEEAFTSAPIKVEGAFDLPTDQSPFVEIQFPFNQNSHHTIDGPGGLGYREEGGVRILIYVRRKGSAQFGITTGKQWAKQIADAFRAAEFEGVRCFAPSSPTVDNSNDEGGYYGLSFVIPYEFHFQQEG